MKTDFQIIKVDETEQWSDEIKNQVGKIYCVYLYDKSVVTHCAEITPSYDMHPLYYTTGLSPDKYSEEVGEHVHDQFRDGEPVYFHCSFVEKQEHYPVETMLALNKDVWAGQDNDEYNELVESTVEYFKCNHTF